MSHSTSFQEMLLPLAWAYGGATALRNLLYDKGLIPEYRSKLQVVSVGNVSCGGSGKSPFSEYLAKKLLSEGRKPVVLSRGYRGSISGPHLVGPGDRPEDVGDEALMHRLLLREEIPVVVSKRRVEGAKFIEEQSLGDVIVLDDGMQHRRLARNVNLVLVDLSGERDWEAWKAAPLLPAGPLREHLSSALGRTSAVIFVKRESKFKKDSPDLEVRPEGLGPPYFSIVLTPKCFSDIITGEEFPLDAFGGVEGVAATGVAHPEPFFEMLQSLGVSLCEKRSYPDHHAFGPRDVAKLQGMAAVKPLFLTAKDAVKLKRHFRKAGEAYTLQLGVEFTSDEKEREFFQLLLSKTVS